jgi:hypothetical protein
MLLGPAQSMATLLTIILIYAMDSAFISRDKKRKINQQLRLPCKYQIYHEA